MFVNTCMVLCIVIRIDMSTDDYRLWNAYRHVCMSLHTFPYLYTRHVCADMCIDVCIDINLHESGEI